MKFYPTLEETLARRFDDMSEVKDVTRYGMMSGFSDFIYHYELNEIFNTFEREIEDVLNDVGFDLQTLADTCDTFQEMRDKAVWFVVEEFCHRKVDLVESV